MFFFKDKPAVVPHALKNNKAILRRTRPSATNVGALIIIATVDDAETLLQGTHGIAANANPHFDHGVAVVVVTTVGHKHVADTLIAVAIAYAVLPTEAEQAAWWVDPQVDAPVGFARMIDELVFHVGNGLGHSQRQTLADQVQPRRAQEHITLLTWEAPAPLAQRQKYPRC